MNKKIIACCSLVGILLSLSCQKSFLNVQTTTPTPSNDPSVANDLVTGAYSSLIFIDAGGGWNYDTHGISFIAATNIMSDDADKGSFALDQPGINDLDNFTETSGNPFVAALWNGYYAGIARTNNALNALAVAAIDSATVRRLNAEMRFIRGYYYFNLVRFFGGVPIVLYVPSGPRAANTDTTLVTRPSAADVYSKVIIPDLQFAMDNLPLKGQAIKGRITKGAAETLLAKVNMYLKNWQQVFDLTKDVINSGQYSLVSDYSTIWKEVGDNNAESIFEIQTGQFNNSDAGIPLYSECQGPRNNGATWSNPSFPYAPTGDLGWGFCTPSLSLINAYEANDPRKIATIIFVNHDSSTTLWDGFVIPPGSGVQSPYYNYKAYHSEKLESFFNNRDRQIKNVHILRYAEVLLMNAEAATQLGGDAMTPLSQVRARVGLTTASATQMDVWNERRIELAMEHDRFFDIVRQGRAAQVMQAAGKNFKAGINELLPIPGTQIALSGGRLVQNPGY
ncbi:MAG TPA: RagB/SusD family nutrient uptake outer membrane protein [Puia sp.]|nr:RagB/SusD family nutrient uptake outer membrane protein [Puia sp.]